MEQSTHIAPRHVCVIGGSGFIGTRLCLRLEKARIPFSIIDIRKGSRFPELTRIADVRDLAALRTAIEPESAIIHLAAEHRDDVRPLSRYDDVNSVGTKNVCIAASDRAVDTIVFTSSVAVYGFAPIGTGEDGEIKPFNAYGRTKYEAEQWLRSWQAEEPLRRSLSIIRPTVVFGEQNRGNVYNLLRQIASGRFVMVGKGENRKSLAYVENVAAFLEFMTSVKPGVYTANYVDKPDFTMNELVSMVLRLLGRKEAIDWRIPFTLALGGGYLMDIYGRMFRKKPAISSIRVRKFCADSIYSTALSDFGFSPPIALTDALEQTIKYEFLESHAGAELFYSE